MLQTTKDLAVEMQLCVKTVKRWWKKLGVPPDACSAKGCHRWTEAGAKKLLKRWREYWLQRGHQPEAMSQKYNGSFNYDFNQPDLPLFNQKFHASKIQPQKNFQDEAQKPAARRAGNATRGDGR